MHAHMMNWSRCLNRWHMARERDKGQPVGVTFDTRCGSADKFSSQWQPPDDGWVQAIQPISPADSFLDWKLWSEIELSAAFSSSFLLQPSLPQKWACYFTIVMSFCFFFFLLQVWDVLAALFFWKPLWDGAAQQALTKLICFDFVWPMQPLQEE